MPTTRSASGATLSFQVREGDGPTLIFTNGIATVDSYWRPLLDHLAGRARLVTWDLPGHGDSAPAPTREATAMPARADDVFRVADAAGATGPVVLFGFSMGCQLILEAWRQRPDRVRALVPAFGSFGRPFDAFIHPSVGPRAFNLYRRLGPRRNRALFRTGYLASRLPGFHTLNKLTWMVGPTTTHDQMRPFYDHMDRIDSRTWTWMIAGAQEHTALDYLPEIDVPTLVFAGGRDLFTPASRGRTIAERVPAARLVELPKATHTGLLDESDRVHQEVDAFLLQHQLLHR